MRSVFCLLFVLISVSLQAQQNTPADVEELKAEVLKLRTDVNQIQVNLSTSQNKFKRGIAVATLGYTVTIAGGLLLGQNENLGKALLVSGGATGITGTILMVDAFKYLGRKTDSKNNDKR